MTDEGIPTHPLAQPLPTEQQTLINVIGDVWMTNNGRWPVYSYVERTLDQSGLKAEQVLANLPGIGSVQFVGGKPAYGLAWYDHMAGRPNSEIGLTVAGLAHLPRDNQAVVGLFIKAVEIMARVRGTANLDPFATEEEVITSRQLAQSANRISNDWVKWMPALFAHEPCVWGGEMQTDENGDWSWRLGSGLRNFTGVANFNDYLWRTTNLLTPERPADPSVASEAPLEDPLAQQLPVPDAPKVFLSHASEDKVTFVEPLARELRRQGVDAWLDKWELLPGDSLVEKIFDEGLASADAFVVVISEASLNKPWVREELNAAVVARITKNTRLIPIRLGEAVMPTSLSATVWEDASNDAEGARKAAKRIVQAVHGGIQRPTLGTPPTYLASASTVPGLAPQDATLLLAAVTQAVESNHLMLLDWERLKATVGRDGLDAEAAMESLNVLATADYFDVEGYEDQVQMLSLTPWGYSQGWPALRSDHEAVYDRIGVELLNGEPSSIEDLANAVGEPSLIVERVLSDLQDLSLVSYSLTMGSSMIHSVNPALRRHLQTRQ